MIRGLIGLAFFCSSLHAQVSDTARLSLVFAGDIMGHDEQIKGAWDSTNKTYNYEPVFRYIKPYIADAGIAVGNLEVTLAGPPYKGYPQFSSPDALAIAAREAGFDVFIQANNHALDRGPSGFKRTLATLDSLNILHTGTFTDAGSREKNHPLLVEKNHISTAILNYTYGTNGLEIPPPFVINRIDTAVIRRDLQKARLAHPDFVVVTIHWGEEYQRFPNQKQHDLADFILRHGADAIIGSHPHVVQPGEIIYAADSTISQLVVYSLGNFVSNQRAQYKDGGIMVGIDLLKTGPVTRIENVTYLPYWVYRADYSGKSTFYVLPVDYYEKYAVPELQDYDRYKITRFAEDTREHMKNIPERRFFSDP